MENRDQIPVTDELIVRYLAGEAGPDEAMALHNWLRSSANKEYFESLQGAWNSARPGTSPRSVDPAAAWKAVESRMGSPGGGSRTLWRYLAVAATLAVFVAASLYFVSSDSSAPAMRVLVSGDSLKHVDLPDRSSVTLNRNTTFSFPDAFGSGNREVALEKGEGFFDITPDPAAPFIVRTPLGDVRVLGTSFNLRVDSFRLSLSVREGRVLLITPRDTAVVDAGHTAESADGGTIASAGNADVNQWGYATGFFVFRDEPLFSVMTRIEDSFGCEVILANENIARCRVNATFDDVSVENMLSLIAETFNLSVEHHGNTFRIEGEGCH